MKTLTFVIVLFLSLDSRAFIVKPRVGSWHLAPAVMRPIGPSLPRAISGPARNEVSSSTTLLYDTSPNVDGTGRGKPILILAVAFCIWLFSIPPEFRRAYICSSSACEENRVACNNCVTVSEWKAGVQEYYANGGGIQFDFSIDPKSRAAFDEKFGLK